MSERLKVYLETTFVSWLVARPATLVRSACIQAYTRRWWQEYADRCELYVSPIVVREASKGDIEQVQKRLDIVNGLNLLDSEIGAVKDLARKLVIGHAIPEEESADALHIATAAVYGMDMLLTWNCKHMANLATLPKTIGIISKAGYECPQIITPEAILEDESDGKI